MSVVARSLLSIAGWCAGLAVAGIVVAPGGPADGWIEGMPPEVRPAAIALRVVAVAATFQLSVATAAAIVGTVVPSAQRLAGLVGSPAFVRRLAAGAIGIGLSAGPAVAAAAPPPATTPVQVEEPPAGDVTYLRRAPAEEPPTAEPAPGRHWDVRPGDHLWAIAEQTLAADLGRLPTDGEVHRFWRLLIAANRHLLASPDDADLIFPGQRFELPRG